MTVLSAQTPLDPALIDTAFTHKADDTGGKTTAPLIPFDTDSSPASKLNESGLPAQPLTGPVPPTLAPWPWRHVIHIEGTVPLSENRLRYYDHPVVKILATWRELSWYELYALGETIDHE